MSRIKDRLNLWITVPAELKCKSYIFLATLGSFVARSVQFGKLPFFSDKQNFLNQIFVKQCWGWTLLVISIFTAIRYIWHKATIRRVYLVVLRLLFGTLYWYVMTSLIDGFKDNVGRCTNPEFNNRKDCVLEGFGKWKYMMDISGHMFMMVFCNLFITHHVDEVLDSEKGELSIPDLICVILCRLLVTMFEVMMVFTVLYWHSPPEKILGTLAGVLGYTLLFTRLSRFLPSNWVN